MAAEPPALAPAQSAARDHQHAALARIFEVQQVCGLMVELVEECDGEALHPARMSALFTVLETHIGAAIELTELGLEAR